MPFYSPLRYPGGKRKLASFVESLIEANGFDRAMYVEPYAGGAAVALHLLFETNLPRIVINDLDPAIYSFWEAVKNHPEELCRRIFDVRVNMEEWHKQKAVQIAKKPCCIDLAFSTFFLNRTNRSGVLLGGVIGGKEQRGAWKMTARFNRKTLIGRIEAINSEAARLEISGLDATVLIKELVGKNESAFLFLDPPYYHKTYKNLYRNDYIPSDHKTIANLLEDVGLPWLLTYDECPEVRELYWPIKPIPFSLSYTVGQKRRGNELLFVSPNVVVPPIDSKNSRNAVKFSLDNMPTSH